MPTRTVRLYMDYVDRVEVLAELDSDASHAVKAQDVEGCLYGSGTRCDWQYEYPDWLRGASDRRW